jgi:IS30 family transposase
MGARGGPLRCVKDRFWALVREGASVTDAGVDVGISRKTSFRWSVETGGVIPPVPVRAGLRLSLEEREEIAVGLERRECPARIAARLGRARSTITREIARSRVLVGGGAVVGGGHNKAYPKPYRAVAAQRKAEARARRPKPSKLATNQRLHDEVAQGLKDLWSPEQISHRLVEDFPADVEMRVSHEAIYQSLYVQARGGLRRELSACLRTGRAVRQRHHRGVQGRGKIREMVSIADRPAEVEDRALPGDWEGDLIIGKMSGSAIGTLVDRMTRYVLLLHLPPGDHGAEAVRDAMIVAIDGLPEHLWRSLTWDQGTEMSRHCQITETTGVPIYFCDPHSPWQRGTNENTNGLLRQYFPKGTDLSVHSPEDLIAVAAQLNGRPRKALDWRTPAEALNKLLSEPFNPPMLR